MSRICLALCLIALMPWCLASCAWQCRPALSLGLHERPLESLTLRCTRPLP